MAEPVSDWVHDILLFSPSHRARLVTKLRIPPVLLSPGNQFCTSGVFHFRVFMDDDFNDRGMQLIAVAHRRRAAFNIADVAAFISHQNGAVQLPPVLSALMRK